MPKLSDTKLNSSNNFFDRERQELCLANTVVKTPTFMPVATRAAAKGLTVEQVRSTGAQILLGNTYHLNLAPGEDLIAEAGGLSDFCHWDGPMLTDSGGYQVFSLAKQRKITEEGVEFVNPANGDKLMLTPEKSIQIQHKLGADIIMTFDDVVDLDPKERHRTLDAMERTHRWLERCVVEHQRLSKASKNPPKLFGIVQGGLDKELRKQSYEFVASQPVDGIAIGGLSVGEAREEMHDMLKFLQPLYDSSLPQYLMGVGHPIDMTFAIEHGIDMFDCVLPTRNARHGTAWLSDGTQFSVRNSGHEHDHGPIEQDCDCYTCSNNYSKAYLRHLLRVGEATGGTLLSMHNLRVVQRLCEQYQK